MMHKGVAAAKSGSTHVLGNEFWTRLASGLVLAVLALVAAYAGTVPFALLVAVFAVLMSWEWGRLVRSGDFDLPLVLHAGTVVLAVLLAAFGQTGFAVLVLVIGTVVVGAACYGDGGRFSALGVAYTGVPSVAMVWLRADEPYGFLAALFLFAIVWLSDTAAFAAGRAIGGPKLWSKVSPNKTWAGVAGGLVGALIAGTLIHLLTTGSEFEYLCVVALILGLSAQAGDLAESAIKRWAGAKDSSHLIPGHGGVMDRMDSLVAVATLSGLLALLFNAHAPARALLLGA